MPSDKFVGEAVVTGGCGFVGRHLTNELLRRKSIVWLIDDLSTGKHPDLWLGPTWRKSRSRPDTECYSSGQQRVLFTEGDLITFLIANDPIDQILSEFDIADLGDIFHFASVVGGRAKIDGDPMAVAIDLAIDAALFRWVVHNRRHVSRLLYASSSAAYPVHLQQGDHTVALREEYISFGEKLGQPDMTYGWSKLSGEYLARIAARHYGIHVACVRPFSGYGGDQDGTYPVPAIARRAAMRENPLIVWGSGEQGRDFVHIDDCIAAMLLAIDKISDGSSVNIGSGRLTTFNEVASMLSRFAGYKPRIKPLVDKPVGVESRYADTSHMKEVLQWMPQIDLEEGLRRVLAEQIGEVQSDHPCPKQNL